MEIFFFDFRSKFALSNFLAGPVGIDDYLDLIKGNYEGINFPVIFKQDSGKNFKDILDTG